MKSMHSHFALLIILFFVMGCATQAQRQSESIQQALETAINQVELCNDNKEQNKSVQYVYANIIIKDNNSSNKYVLLSSNEKINNEMKSHLVTYLEKNQECRNMLVGNLEKAHQSFASVVVNSHRRADNLFGKLMSGEVTIGEFNRQLQESKNILSNQWSEVAYNINAALESAHGNEVAVRQRAAAAIQNSSIRSQNNRPITTNCNMLGNSVNCTSY